MPLPSGRMHSIDTVGIVATGDMGHAIGQVLRMSGARVVTYLGGRSERTAALARRAGVVSLPTLADVARESDLLMSVVPPACATAVAADVARVLREGGATLLYADCNSVAPRTARDVAATIDSVGGMPVDVSIVGGPPMPEWRVGSGTPRFYASGRHAAYFAQLSGRGIDVRILEGEIGTASGLKMCYDAILKSTVAVSTELLVAAERLGVGGAVARELEAAQPKLLHFMRTRIPRMPPKASRWVGEMREIGTTFQDIGLPRGLLDGAGEVYAWVAATELGLETPEERRLGRTMEGVVELLVNALPEKG